MYHKIKSILIDIFKEYDLNTSDIILETPKNSSFGSLSTPLAFVLAKKLKKPPNVISKELENSIKASKYASCFSAVNSIGGYVNFEFSYEFLCSFKDSFLIPPKLEPQKILIEYVSANPTGPLHIAHARGAILGDILIRLGKFLGHQMYGEYYINDAGAQIRKLGLSVQFFGKKHLLNEDISEPESYYVGDYVLDIAKEALRSFGEDIFNDIAKLEHFAKDLMLKEIKENLELLDITLDNFVSEKEMLQDFEAIFNTLLKNDAIYYKDNKAFLKSTQFNDEKDRVIVKENGELAYIAGDIIYHDFKFKRKFDRYINIFGADHHGYISRINASLEFLGHDSKNLEYIIIQMVSLLENGKPYRMSKRAGNFILLKDVINDIGSSAARFIFASKKQNSPLEFDTNTLKSQDQNNPIFYINYANSRIHTLLKKAKDDIKINTETEDIDALQKDLLDLMFLSLSITKVIESAFNERAVHKICDYLIELSARFHGFYNNHQILKSSLRDRILEVLELVTQSIEHGMALLGIKAKRQM